VEYLERRDLPSASWPGLMQPVSADGVNHTIDQRQDLGTLSPAAGLGVVGTIANTPSGGGEVDFYQFTLGNAAQVQISTLDHAGGSGLSTVLTLYQPNSQTITGYQVIAQDDGSTHGGDAALSQTLLAGTYVIAVSGAGNRYFYPYLDGSGYPGSTGSYGLSIQARPPGPPASSPPPVTPNPVADDTVATATDLGDISNGRLVQAAGILGNDPRDPLTSHNNSDVDMYQFHINVAGTYAFGAEVFAGRIGSPLDAALTLFQQTPSGLVFLASNGNSMNTTMGTDGNQPLYTDPALTAPLTQGDYFIAVSSGLDYVDPAVGQIAGQTVFDPLTTDSGQGGNSSGNYVLNLRVEPSVPHTPHVVSVSIANGAVLDAPPTAINVRFDQPMNVQQLTVEAYTHTFTAGIPQVFIAGPDATTTFSPRLTAYDPRTNVATFSLLDALPNGAYTLHLSGPQGLDDLAGTPLAGNDLSGDYVVHFSVAGPARGTAGVVTTWTTTEPNDSLQHPQIIGPLFPDEVGGVVTIMRPAGLIPSASSDTTDFYRITLLQSQSYVFSLVPLSGLDPNIVPTVWSGGSQVSTIDFGTGAVNVNLDPGTYVIGVDWTGTGATDVSYQLQISMLGAPETAPSLTTGPAPLLSVQLVSDPPSSVSPTVITAAAPVSTPSTVVLIGGPVVPALPPVSTTTSGFFLALADTPAAATGGTTVAVVDANPAAGQGTSVTQLSLLPGVLVSIHTLGLGIGDEAITEAAGTETASAGGKPLTVRFQEALWAVDTFLPEINVAEAVKTVTGIIDSVYISWGRKSPVARTAPTPPPASPTTDGAEGSVALAQEWTDSTAVTGSAGAASPTEAQAPPVLDAAPVQKRPAAWRFSPWNAALAGLGACALLLGPLHVLRARRHRNGRPPSSPGL
jgi:hypothetical protein